MDLFDITHESLKDLERIIFDDRLFYRISPLPMERIERIKNRINDDISVPDLILSMFLNGDKSIIEIVESQHIKYIKDLLYVFDFVDLRNLITNQ